MAKGERVNVQRTLAFVGFFYFIFSAGKACLFPFLTIYFRQLGLSATQTGIILGLKPFVALIAAPFWVRCAIRHNKRRVILMTAIFALIATNLGLTLIPPVHKDAPFEFCSYRAHANETDRNSSHYMMTPYLGKIEEYVFHTKTKEGALPSTLSALTAPPGLTTKATSDMKASQDQTTLSPPNSPSVLDAMSSKGKSNLNENAEETIEITPKQNSGVNGAQKRPYSDDNSDGINIDENNSDGINSDRINSDRINSDRINSDRINSKYEVENVVDGDTTSHPGSTTVTMDDETLEEAIAYLKEQLKNKLESIDDTVGTDNGDFYETRYQVNSLRAKRQIEETKHQNATHGEYLSDESLIELEIRDKEQEILEEESLQLEYITFMTALVIVILGEIMSSSADKLCDDSLYETLDHINEVDKYDRHHVVSLISLGLATACVTVAVHFSDCLIFLDASRFMIHFYAFAILCGGAFLLSFCYPIEDSGRNIRQDRLFRALGLMLTDFHNIVVTITLVLAGFLSASLQNYTFWLIQDLGGSEIIMGLTVTVSCAVEIPLLITSGRLTRKLGHIGTLAAAVFALGVRLIYFTYLWTPWAAVPIEILNIFCKGALWEAVMLYADQASPPGMHRSMQIVMVILYYGFGASNGSVISGILYDHVGLKQVYLSFAIVAFMWAASLVVIAKCVPKRRKLHYSKILRDDDDDNNNDDDIFEDSDEADDWLVNALKHDKF